MPASTDVVTVAPEAISGLTPATLYHYRLRAKNKWHEAVGETQTFTTASDSSTTTSGGPPTAPSGSELGPSLTPPMSQPLAPAPSPATTPAAPGKTTKTTKKVAKCKRGYRREHGRCLKQKKQRRAGEKRSSPTTSRRKARS